MRPSTACSACRKGKRRCRSSKIDVNAACLRCAKMRIHCSLENDELNVTTRPQSSSQSPNASQYVSPKSHSVSEGTVSGPHDIINDASDVSKTQDSDASMLDPVWKQKMVARYFEIVHDTHHSLFHRPTFERDLMNNKIPDVIIFAVLSLGSRCTSSPRRYVHRFAERARRALDLRDLSIITIQGCLLLGAICSVDNEVASEALYCATAIRLGLILNISQRPCATEIERQINLRVYWTLYMSDIWISGGLKISRQLHFREEVELPTEEWRFLSLSSTEPMHIPREPMPSIWGEMAKLARIWSDIQDLNVLAVQRGLEPMALTVEVDAIAERLSRWQQQLPSYLQECEENLERANAKDICVSNSYAALHLGFHYYHEVLFYRFMAESDRNPSVHAIAYKEKCAYHAQAFCDLLYLCKSKEIRCSYSMVGHMLVVTSTIYMHRLLCSTGNMLAEKQAPEIRKRLARNFEILTELQLHWVSLDTCLSRLKVFHKACLSSIEHSFNMDRWMLRFILEHGSNMPEKFAMQPEDAHEIEILGGAQSAVGGSASSLQDWYMQALS